MEITVWKFVNKKTLDIIRVLDGGSAKNLKKLIGNDSHDWVVLTENPALKPQPNAAVKAPSGAHANQERRKFKRHTSRFRVILIGAGKSLRTYSADISLGGMRLSIQAPKEMVGETCRLFIAKSETGENLELKCQVISGEKGNSGVQYIDVSDSTKQQLDRWIKDAEERSSSSPVKGEVGGSGLPATSLPSRPAGAGIRSTGGQKATARKG